VIVVADTGAIYALLDRDDRWHDPVREWWQSAGARVVLPHSILPEVCWLVGRRLGAAAEATFVRSLANGDWQLEGLLTEDLAVIAGLVERYRDLPLGFVDAAVLTIAARLRADAILTTDRRHFTVARLPEESPPRLVP